MKYILLLAGALLCAISSAHAAGRVCIPIETGRFMDNGQRVIQVVCVEEGRPLPMKLRIVEDEKSR